MTKLNFSVIPHTHWDKEWYFTTSKSINYSLFDFREVLTELESNPRFTSFLLDAQTSILDDYLTFHPEDLDRVKTLIKNNRLITGPWYSQSDQMVISGESIVRNLLYGTKRAKDLGKCMMVGYMPDSFGQTAQMPQILNGFNIYHNVFRRGLKDSQCDKAEFYWESEDGSRVFNNNIYDYGNFTHISKDRLKLEKIVNNLVKELADRSLTKNIILTNGGDQRPIRKNLPEILDVGNSLSEDISFKMSDLESELKNMEAMDINFPLVKGEMTSGQYSRAHKSIFSNRADLKILNNRCENLLTNIGEPLETIGYSLGFKYENLIFEKAWKLMCDNAAHDSSGMCNSDETNRDIEHRFKQVFDLISSRGEVLKRVIGMGVEKVCPYQFQVYNMLPYDRDEVIKVEIFTPSSSFEILNSKKECIDFTIISIEELPKKITDKMFLEIGFDNDENPSWIKNFDKLYKVELYLNCKNLSSMGYNTFFVKKSDEAAHEFSTGTNFIENNLLKIEIKDNKINIFDKRNSTSHEDILRFENSGDDGDTYDYSEPRKDSILTSEKIENIKASLSKNISILEYSTSLNIPKNLSNRGINIFDKTLNIKVKIELTDNSDLPNFLIEIENNAIEHRVRALIKSNYITPKHSIADLQFGSIQRPLYLEEVEGWRENGWNEKPRTIEPLQNFVAIEENEKRLALYTDCVREYQIVGENYNTIALTLYRSVPMMGKPDLLDRPGRASGMEWATPDSTLLKKLEFKFSIDLTDNMSITEMSRKAKAYNTPAQYYQAAEFKNFDGYFLLRNQTESIFQLDYSLFKFNSNNTILSAVKKEEFGDALILRLFNPNNKEVTSESISLGLTIKDIKCVKLDETTVLNELPNSKDITLDSIKRNEAITLKIEI